MFLEQRSKFKFSEVISVSIIWLEFNQLFETNKLTKTIKFMRNKTFVSNKNVKLIGKDQLIKKWLHKIFFSVTGQNYFLSTSAADNGDSEFL